MTTYRAMVYKIVPISASSIEEAEREARLVARRWDMDGVSCVWREAKTAGHLRGPGDLPTPSATQTEGPAGPAPQS